MYLNSNVVTIKGVDETLQSVMNKYRELHQTFDDLSNFSLGIELNIDETSKPQIEVDIPQIDELMENISIHRYKLQEFEEIVKTAKLTVYKFSKKMNQPLR